MFREINVLDEIVAITYNSTKFKNPIYPKPCYLRKTVKKSDHYFLFLILLFQNKEIQVFKGCAHTSAKSMLL